MDRRTLIAIALCFLIFFGWQKLYLEPKFGPGVGSGAVSQQTQTALPGAPAPAAPQSSGASKGAVVQATLKDIPPQTEALQTGTGDAKVSNGSKVFSDWELEAYRLNIDPKAAAVNFQSVTHSPEGELGFDFELPELGYLATQRGELKRVSAGELKWTYEDENVSLTREIRSDAQKPYAEVVLSGRFKKTAPKFAFVSLSSRSFEQDPEQIDRQLVYFADNSLETIGLTDSVEMQQISKNVQWIGSSSRYFLMAVVNDSPLQPIGLVQPVAALQPILFEGQQYAPTAGRINLVYPVQGDTFRIQLKTFFGPKELDLLRSVDKTLDHAVDLGWFSWAAYPLLRLLKWFHSLVGNWGVAIILLTILVKVALFPLTYKSMKNMKAMQKIQPELNRVREKYKDDKVALNQEMLKLMKSQGANPMAGCLPILMQMPVFFALYRVLYSAIELYQAPFMFWIHDLAAKDPYYVTPILLTGVMFVQQKLTPMQAGIDPMQQKMMLYMPVMFGVFMLGLPSGLTLYMLINALVSIIQQLIMNKKLGLGPVPANTPIVVR